MKKTIIYLCILFLVVGITSIQAQESSSPANQVEVKKAVADDNILDDPKLSTEELEQMRTAGTDNPDKISSPAVDQKLEPAEIPAEENYGINNDKVGPIDRVAENIRRIEQENLIINEEPTTAIQQPQEEGETPVNVTNYRTMKGPDTQETGTKPDKITDYSKLKGPDTQPEGDKPSGDDK
jgi:hypothetical protein